MLDQSFSAHNFEIIFNMENRKGHIDLTTMSQAYQDVSAKIKIAKSQVQIVRNKKKLDRTPEDLLLMKDFDLKMKGLQKEKMEALTEDMISVADEVNRSSFKFEIDKHFYNGKEEFSIRKSRASCYAMKQLLHNMKRTFKIEMPGRHQIMTSIKCLLNMSMPIYIIRTDIDSFFESIPQDPLFQLVYCNNLLSFKSKSFIKQIFQTYENIKDSSKTAKNVGVPRGIGISAMLSEIYMENLDKILRSRPGVIFYVRYVDDIFMVLTSLEPFLGLPEYYRDMQEIFKRNGLTLKSTDSDKCKLIKYTPDSFSPVSFDYLGYKLNLTKPEKILTIKYSMSDKKILKLNNRIEKAFIHFEALSKKDVKKARRDLLDSLNFITGNFRLSNSKSHVKAGLYFSNDLIDNPSELDQFTDLLHSHPINPYVGLFSNSEQQQNFIKALQRRIHKIDFKEHWEKRIMYDFSSSRIAEISSWL